MMHEEQIKRLRDAATMSEALAVLLPHSAGNATAKLYNEAADAIEERDRHILTLQHEMMAEAESHIAEVNRLNKQIEELSNELIELKLLTCCCGEPPKEEEA